MAAHPSTALTSTFLYPQNEPQYSIKWTHLGPPAAQPLILLHGTPWSSRLWAPFALALSSKYRVYIFDNPGYGLSTQLTPSAVADFIDNGSLSKQAEITAALFAHWGFSPSSSDHTQPRTATEKPHVIAHDNAGLVALRLLLNHAVPLASLTLIDVVAVGPWGLPFFHLVANNYNVFTSLPPSIFDGIVRAYIRDAAHKPLTKDDEDMLAAPWVSGEGRPGQEGFIRVLRQASKRVSEDVESRYHELGEGDVPVRIVWGREDKWIGYENAERLRALIGGETEVVLLEEAGHLIMLDQPVRLMVEVMRFLGEVEGRG